MAARPLVTVFSLSGEKAGEVTLPEVMTAPLRPDIVQFVHTNMNKNHRQAYAVSVRAGKNVSASSWGTGRAVARIPRVGGGGTSRSGQGAFGNMCRGGRMFAPTKTWRKWNRKINTTQKRYAVASALAASAVPALVMARGHRIDDVPEIPLVVDDSVQSLKKTSAAKDALAAVGAMDDVEKAANSKKIRAGKGKMRNRRYTLRRGPLVVYASNDGVEQAFRNLPGVELCDVSRLNLLQLAPGGHLGRFCVWSKSALEALDSIHGVDGKAIPDASMNNADLARIINSDEVQSVVNPAKLGQVRRLRKKNPLTSVKALAKLDPYRAAARLAETRAQEARASKKDEILKKKRETAKAKKQYKAQGKAFYEKASMQGDVCATGFGV
uniref:Large ribosomal subunit protein uL4 C-terminal domain-containing protein n=1 Tax=Trieres chinensis TaxID=1514140 RepID=A0A7S1ZGY2_TRICV|mmetsp:Transcript_25378/g.51896  ORF Transcript_25378/g.51896 Transcript_25378/m.51896 type:complete len:382 (+) Transcript_25378:125-1270(+)|eukprot:CAMPEP_0183291132 /NCGR_PEP_ID=MMETSP0160_2-20130417/654_1 /TAXON_ID=2839 ORGANISM="Odontella Sinensis, Strain Grunow 1884" /NCGR_SAMPLE_ID=MMETSP0160_2 /ASSEMBLY_ACC=CAM_ASM_000250 /LENGTH=381 /DNA_ID=CAMNT_0025451891 /DNA_START=121 /DNA_END=1266 /DNA_ORIENTATION=+